VAQLANFSAWQIETDDLTELGVVDIDAGSPVTISVDAIPELELTGQVASIKPIGENKRGDITYTVIVEPQQQDERLRWNMTTVVSIEPSSGEGLAQSQR
jgi:HlyD family secretion protein